MVPKARELEKWAEVVEVMVAEETTTMEAEEEGATEMLEVRVEEVA